VLQTLADTVDARPATQDTVPGGNGSPTAVAVVAMDKYLPGQRPGEFLEGSGQNASVAR
jgi:serine/threonine-protein kinase RsbW